MAKCFLFNSLCEDSIVYLGQKAMDTKDLDKEMGLNTPLGEKLRKIAGKVEAL